MDCACSTEPSPAGAGTIGLCLWCQGALMLSHAWYWDVQITIELASCNIELSSLYH